MPRSPRSLASWVRQPHFWSLMIIMSSVSAHHDSTDSLHIFLSLLQLMQGPVLLKEILRSASASGHFPPKK
ncbi:hypothetical protein HZ326_3649 [Fusarium oxysporum f. sp. albedinis]|nr:hypothetical protein HZ326_3649 [Fusarium oxysporum f. sp. albedinis]